MGGHSRHRIFARKAARCYGGKRSLSPRAKQLQPANPTAAVLAPCKRPGYSYVVVVTLLLTTTTPPRRLPARACICFHASHERLVRLLALTVVTPFLPFAFSLIHLLQKPEAPPPRHPPPGLALLALVSSVPEGSWIRLGQGILILP